MVQSLKFPKERMIGYGNSALFKMIFNLSELKYMGKLLTNWLHVV